jgi:TonB family protein
MNAQPKIIPESSAKQVGAYIRWQLPESDTVIDFHRNALQLIQHSAARSVGQPIAGVLLGRVNRGRQVTFTIEDCDPAMTKRGLESSPFADRALVETISTRWRPGESRLSVIGLYRSGHDANLSGIDLAALGLTVDRARSGATVARGSHGAGSPERSSERLSEVAGTSATDDSERVFLCIEPSAYRKSDTVILYLTRNGVVVWQSPETGLDRREFAKMPAVKLPPVPDEAQDGRVLNIPADASADAENKVSVLPPSEPLDLKKDLLPSRAWTVSVLCVGALALLIGGLWHSGFLSKSMFRPSPPALPDTSDIELKIEQSGSAWRLSWNPDSSVVLSATKGHLAINDGPLHKSLDLDPSDMRGGNVVYTPATDDVTFELELDTPDSQTPISESVHAMGGLPSASQSTASDTSNYQDEQLRVPNDGDDSGLGQPVTPLANGGSHPGGEKAAINPSMNATPANPPASSSGNAAANPAVRVTINSAMSPAINTATNPAMNSAPGAPAKASANPTPAKPATSVSIGAPAKAPTSAPINVSVKAPGNAPVNPSVKAMPSASIKAAGNRPATSLAPAASVRPAAEPKSKMAFAIAHPEKKVRLERGERAERPSSLSLSDALPELDPPRPVRQGGLIEPAQLISKIDATYPETAEQIHVTGAVELHFIIDADGQVRNVSVVRGPSLLAESAVQALEKWHYRPARLDGIPTATQGNAVFTFRLN